MNNNNFDAIIEDLSIEDLSIEDLRTKYTELIDSYNILMFYYKTLNLTAKMLKIENRVLRAKLNKSKNIQELVYDGLGDK